MQDDNNHPRRGLLKAAFQRAVEPALAKLGYLTTNYPSRMAAATGAVGDGMFLIQSAVSGNYLGVYAAFIGAYASIHLYRYGDPKITEAQLKDFIDPQDQRNIANWLNHPTKYPWEYMALIRMISMSSMFLGSIGLGSMNSGISYGELSYSIFALTGYFIKMGIAEKEKGSVSVPEEAKGFLKKTYELKAYIQENPNPTAGVIWNTGLAPYALEGVVNGEPFKIASAVLYALPNTFTMFSSKRAQVAPQQSLT